MSNSTEKILACPECDSGAELNTIEHLTALSRIETISEDGQISFEGWTDYIDDSMQTKGIQCRCGWKYLGNDYLEKLKLIEARFD